MFPVKIPQSSHKFFLSEAGTVSGFQGRLDEMGFGCGNSREKCDAAFLENRELCVHRVCRKIFVKVPGKISGEIFLGKI